MEDDNLAKLTALAELDTDTEEEPADFDEIPTHVILAEQVFSFISYSLSPSTILLTLLSLVFLILFFIAHHHISTPNC